MIFDAVLFKMKGQYQTGLSGVTITWGLYQYCLFYQGLLLLTWFDFNPSMDK